MIFRSKNFSTMNEIKKKIEELQDLISRMPGKEEIEAVLLVERILSADSEDSALSKVKSEIEKLIKNKHYLETALQSAGLAGEYGKRVAADMVADNRKLRYDIDRLEEEIKILTDNQKKNVDLVTCDKCGCAVIKKDAFKGESRVGLKRKVEMTDFGPLFSQDESVIKTYYCKRCAKKKEKQP